MQNKKVFVKEDRYLVIKRADLEAATAAGLLSVGQIGILNKILCESSRIRSNRGARPLHGLFVESDWPEYDAVLKMISDRVEGVDGADKQGPILYCIVDADGLPFMQEYCVDLDAAALQKEVDAMNDQDVIPPGGDGFRVVPLEVYSISGAQQRNAWSTIFDRFRRTFPEQMNVPNRNATTMVDDLLGEYGEIRDSAQAVIDELEEAASHSPEARPAINNAIKLLRGLHK
ncbi:hypothetical protein [Enterobacter hormaechei]|uniref:hypothetical protein n=1 Tax=Enterobacter hormaechei TaxID=158836 RepID=UPI003F4314A4